MAAARESGQSGGCRNLMLQRQHTCTARTPKGNRLHHLTLNNSYLRSASLQIHEQLKFACHLTKPTGSTQILKTNMFIGDSTPDIQLLQGSGNYVHRLIYVE
jgi:hypothetical protein